ncbi:LysE family translocator [Aurantiacibacter xanthus]|uniref:LysE family translocator n=1 Tax=Aurantiacibacter xanthus TaxID=1784712 RepID=A0A3A1P4S2_9SPHN|nr:LysE family translocator [Aurantiacibacter xanthus]RIV87404.1 LysE family translocator [Aurantiacibacter xanthus]
MDSSFASLALFALVGSITPGPNNIMLMTSGANFGLRRSLPLALGIIVGFPMLIALSGLGAAAILLAHPEAAVAFRAGCALVVLWLAWKLARSSPSTARAAPGKPVGFFEALSLQFINAKAWVVAIAASALFAPGGSYTDVAVLTGVFLVVNIPCAVAWLVAGRGIERVLRKESHLRAFNFVMAALLLGSTLPALIWPA